MADRMAQRAQAIEDFAALLRTLRATAGTPSFRQMSGRSQAISHTTLHEAAQGHRFPSWATTAEFVKACGEDPGQYRARWEQANRAIQAAGSTATPADVPSAELDGAHPRAGAVPDQAVHLGVAGREGTKAADHELGHADPAPPPPRRRRSYVLPVAAALAVLATSAVTVGVISSRGKKYDPSSASPSSQHTAANSQFTPPDCPVHAADPPAAAPAHPGDASAFIADVTLPDCSHVRRERTALKVWRLKNVGTVAWVGYSLHRVELPQPHNQCHTITDVPITATRPGETVDIAVEVTTPSTPLFCYLQFKMHDAAGNVAFPGRRPINAQIIVD